MQSAAEKAEELVKRDVDMLCFGVGFIKSYADGTVRHIPRGDVICETAPTKSPAAASA